jgi:triosephosphate isomerase
LGSYTGSIPAKLLATLGVKYCLIGHSERRRYFHETNIDIGLKFDQLIENQITPIVCAQTKEEIPPQVFDQPPEKFITMYEPASAISTNGNYHPDSIEDIETTITNWQKTLGLQCRFLYGGSVNPENISSFKNLLTTRLSGFVVGHASLDPHEFSQLLKHLELVTGD